MKTPKNILLASGKLAQASKLVLGSSSTGLSNAQARLDEALQEYNTLVFEALSSGVIDIEDVIELNIDNWPPHAIEHIRQFKIASFRPRRK
jgi:hypothetical protein